MGLRHETIVNLLDDDLQSPEHEERSEGTTTSRERGRPTDVFAGWKGRTDFRYSQSKSDEWNKELVLSTRRSMGEGI